MLLKYALWVAKDCHMQICYQQKIYSKPKFNTHPLNDGGIGHDHRTQIILTIQNIHAQIQEFSSGGVQVNLTKKALTTFFFFLVLSSFYRSQMVNFKENYHFSRFQTGSNIFQGGGGVQLLIPYRNPYNLWFSRGGGGGLWTPCPPSPPPPPPPPLWIRTWYQSTQGCY